jgi:hypothetical protein
LDAFAIADLYLKPEKSKVHPEEVICVGLIVSTKGINMDLVTIHTVQDWE